MILLFSNPGRRLPVDAGTELKQITRQAARLESRDYLPPNNRIAQNKALVTAAGWLKAGRCREPLISVPDELVQKLCQDLEPKFAKWLALEETVAVN